MDDAQGRWCFSNLRQEASQNADHGFFGEQRYFVPLSLRQRDKMEPKTKDYEEQSLLEEAKAVLEGNWTGTFTMPTPHLYPHQWSWDSAFIAIGYAHYNQEQAEQELRSLFEAQWNNGLIN